jgi:hypothetical protein
VIPVGFGAASESWIAAASGFAGGGVPPPPAAMAAATPPTTSAMESADPAMSRRVDVVRRMFKGVLLPSLVADV